MFEELNRNCFQVKPNQQCLSSLLRFAVWILGVVDYSGSPRAISKKLLSDLFANLLEFLVKIKIQKFAKTKNPLFILTEISASIIF